MVLIPHTYSEWVTILEIFKSKSDDMEVLDAMKQGTIEWQSGVAERFAKRLIDSINYRMKTACKKLQNDLVRARSSECEIVQALLSFRRELSFLAQAINLPALPDKDRQHYLQLVIDQVNYTQKSLEDYAKGDYSGKLLSIVKNHKVNSILKEG